MARSGFLTSIHRLAKQVARENERQRKASQRAYASAQREAEAAQRRGQQAYARAQKASAADLKRLEKEARETHEAARAAEVECKNLNLAEMEEELAGILVATLGVDDFVDLNTLRVGAIHPPFHRQDLTTPSRPPLPIVDSSMPVYTELPPPRGLLSFLSKNKHEHATAKALAKHQEETIRWQAEVARNEGLRAAEAAAYEERERVRQATLKEEQDRYAADCARRDNEADVQNKEVDELIANLAYGTPEAVEEYIGIVLSNAVYPDHFPISHDYSFDPTSAELRLSVAVISPDQLPTVKAYKYVKASDEITEIPFSSKACKDRYAGAVHQVALRVPHEIFEADRRGLIGTISLKVGTHGIDPATGSFSFVPLVALGVARENFMKIELANVQPAATLVHLGASVSKNPYGLISANVSGVRKS